MLRISAKTRYSYKYGWQKRGWQPTQRQRLSEKEELGFEMAEAKDELARLKSLHPIPLIRTARRLERQRQKLEARLARLQHEIDVVEP